MRKSTSDRIRILTWHVHGSYLYYLSFVNCDIYIPFTRYRREGYSGLGDKASYSWPSNLYEIDVDKVKQTEFDLILFQNRSHYLVDSKYLLSKSQNLLPKIYLEHDPPQEHPTSTRHVFGNGDGLLVHVTHFNNLMWDPGSTETRVIEHGVVMQKPKYNGTKSRGVVVINNFKRRGRRLGWDLYEKMRKKIPLDLIGMNTKEEGGLGEIKHKDLAESLSSYRFYFHPVRYSSLGLSLVESMMIGLPVVAYATTEIPEILTDGYNGFTSTDTDKLAARMMLLLKHREVANEIGGKARELAMQRFNINRFKSDWINAIQYTVARYGDKNSAVQYKFKNIQ